MTRLEQLEDVAQKRRIFLREGRYDTPEKGGALKVANRAGVVLNSAQISNTKEKTYVLALEMAHINNGALPRADCYVNPSFHAWALEQSKRRAQGDVIEEFLSHSIIQGALSSGSVSNFWELAEYLDAPEDELNKAFEYHKRKGRVFRLPECWEC